MPRDRASRLLDEFTAVTNAAPRPDAPARRIEMQNRMPMATLTGAAAIVVVVAVAAIVLGRPGPAPSVGSSSSAAPVASAPASQAAQASAQPPASVAPTIGPCAPASLAARITLWEGAAGQRIADVTLTNTGTAPCLLDALDRPQLVAGNGAILIDGAAPAEGGAALTVAPGATLQTLVAAGNYCKPAPKPPVSIAFVLGDGARLIAAPVSPTDATVPPCLGAGSPSTISMHPWAP